VDASRQPRHIKNQQAAGIIRHVGVAAGDEDAKGIARRIVRAGQGGAGGIGYVDNLQAARHIRHVGAAAGDVDALGRARRVVGAGARVGSQLVIVKSASEMSK